MIVFGILAAFAVDAAWDRAQERSAEATVLGSLQVEFTQNLEHLDERLAQHADVAAGAQAFLDIANSGDRSVSADSLSSLVARFTTGWTTNFQRGALSGLVASGQLGVITDRELRARLAGWSSFVDDYSEEEGIGTRQVLEEVLPYLHRILPRPETGIDPSQYASEFRALLDDLEFLNMAAWRVRRSRAIRGEADRLIREAQAILSRIEQ